MRAAPLATAMARLRSLDTLFGAVATAFGLPSLAYPFGRDQGLFFYAAREWLDRGQVLYRDVWDHKPPVIYFIHMLTIALLGEHVWGIRLVELVVAVPLTGWIGARLAFPRGEPIARGSFGAAWLGVAVVQYGYFTFWDTAQCEIWYALFAVGAMTAALRARREALAFAAAGALSALALFTKPPAMPFVVLTVAAIVLRIRGRRGRAPEVARGLGAFAAGGGVVAVVLLAVMAAFHALGPMIDIVVGANSVYVRSEPGLYGDRDVLSRVSDLFVGFTPFSTALVLVGAITAFLGWARRDGELARRYALPVLLALATFAAVAMQGKYYPYHWGALVAPAALFFALLWRDCARVARPRPASGLAAPAAFLAFVAGLFAFSGPSMERWALVVRDTVRYERGAIGIEEFARRFDIPGFYSNRDSVSESPSRACSRRAPSTLSRSWRIRPIC